MSAEQFNGALKLFLYSQLWEGRSCMVVFSASPNKAKEELQRLAFSQHHHRLITVATVGLSITY